MCPAQDDLCVLRRALVRPAQDCRRACCVAPILRRDCSLTQSFAFAFLSLQAFECFLSHSENEAKWEGSLWRNQAPEGHDADAIDILKFLAAPLSSVGGVLKSAYQFPVWLNGLGNETKVSDQVKLAAENSGRHLGCVRGGRKSPSRHRLSEIHFCCNRHRCYKHDARHQKEFSEGSLSQDGAKVERLQQRREKSDEAKIDKIRPWEEA